MTASAAPREETVSYHGIELFVRDQGAGRPLLLINGLGGNVEMWGPLEERLAGVARTIVFDAPGTGRSPTPLLPLSIPALARITAGVLAELGHEQADVLGFSFGGLVAQQLAHDAPALVRRLALAGTACGWGSMPGTLESLALISMPVRFYSRALYERTNRLLSPADSEILVRRPDLAESRLRYPPSLLGYAYQLAAGALWSSLPWLGSVRVPTLVLSAAADHLVPPANGVQLARLLPESRLHTLAGEGHLFVFDPQSRSLPLLEDFFTSRALRACEAWSTGTAVDDDATVEAAFATSIGAQPHRTLSEAFRRLVERAARNGGPL
jgi:pimeloyl-ACP methyl ester carboxylesterase